MFARSVSLIKYSILVSLIYIVNTGTVSAQDPRTIAGPMRGSMHLGNIQQVAAQGMGGAALAVEGSDSLNPAALAWFKTMEVEMAVLHGDFNQGPDTTYYYGEVTFPEPWLGGTLQLMAISISSDTEDSRMGSDTHLWGREVGFAYGVPITGRIAVGVSGYPDNPSEVRIETPGGTLTGRANGKVGSFRVGTLARVFTDESELFGFNPGKLNVAGMYTHIIDSWKTRGLPAGFDDDDTAYINKTNFGLSYTPCDMFMVAFDYEFGNVGGVDIAGDNIDIISFGAEVRPTDWLQLRSGSLDSRFTAGMGLSLPGGWQMDYAYTDGGFEDVKKAFGHATEHAISVSKRF